MRIQIDETIISKFAANAKPSVSPKKGIDNKGSESVVFDEDFGKLLQIASDPSDSKAKVENARLDLKNGRLDTDEAALSAAENILNFGI